jgi:hypothetical protein
MLTPLVPINNFRCAIVIPTHKNQFSPLEKYCITRTVGTLRGWDVFFIIPESLDSSSLHYFSDVESLRFPDKHFETVDDYNKFRLSPKFYEKFVLYERLLICEPDAIVISDQVESWVEHPIDYVGAPWFNLLTISPNFESRPDLNGYKCKLDVGNGGLCMVNPRAILHIFNKHIDLFKDFSNRSGGQLNSDALLAFIGVIDSSFKVASRELASEFSLELDAGRVLRNHGKMPMGFHAMYKYDPDLWMHIFPDSPDPNSPNQAATSFP